MSAGTPGAAGLTGDAVLGSVLGVASVPVDDDDGESAARMTLHQGDDPEHGRCDGREEGDEARARDRGEHESHDAQHERSPGDPPPIGGKSIR